MKETTTQWSKRVKEFEKQFTEKEYKYLGWQLGLHNEDFKRCYELGHMGGKPEGKTHIPTVERSESFSQRGSHDVNWCDECKIWWNTDMSD